MFLTDGNSKLKKDGIVSFDITPAKTCPWAGDCLEWGYCHKLMRIYPSYAAKVERNRKLTLCGAKTLLLAVGPELEKHKGDFVRLHGVGDFYSQRYLDNWVKVFKAFPKKQFYAYSKSLCLDFPKRNFTLIKSWGGKLDRLIKSSDRQALVVPKQGPIPRGFVESKSDLWWLNHSKYAMPRH